MIYNSMMIQIFLIASAFFILNITDQGPIKYKYKRGLDQKCKVNDDCDMKGSYCQQAKAFGQSTCQCDDDRYVPKNGKCVFALPCHLDGTNDGCPPQHNCTRDTEDPEDSEDPKTEIGYCDFQPAEYDENGKCQKGTRSTADGLNCIENQFCKTDQDCYGKGKHQKCFKEYGKWVCRCPNGTKLTKRSECSAGDNANSTNDVQSVSTLKPMDNVTLEQISPNHSTPSPDITTPHHRPWISIITVIAITAVSVIGIAIGCFFAFWWLGKKTERIPRIFSYNRKRTVGENSRPGEDIPLNDMNPEIER